MRASRLISRGLSYYRRSHIAVVLGVATAVSVLAGALIVGDSVRVSLRDLVLQRLGNTDQVVFSTAFFRERLADDLQRDARFGASFTAVAPIVVVRGIVTDQESGRRAGDVRIYGVDDRFWRLHGVTSVAGPADRDALVSPALAREVGGAAGRPILVRVQRPSDVPLDSVLGRKDAVARTMRATVRAVAGPSEVGEFSLEATQGEVRAVFLPLARVQAELDISGRVNALLVRGKGDLPTLVRTAATLEDIGITLQTAPDGRTLILGSSAGVMTDVQAKALTDVLVGGSIRGQPVFTYLANTLRIGTREVPYSLVTALDLRALPGPLNAPNTPNTPNAPNDPNDPSVVVLNSWAARELHARIGDRLTLEYYRWVDSGALVPSMAQFRVAGIVPVEAGSPDLVPNYPGISDSPSLEEWDPPFPVDLSRVRPVDEAYWDRYRTTPKAYVPLEVGQRLWGSRHGAVTSLRAAAPDAAALAALRDRFARRQHSALDPLALGLTVRDVRSESLAASRGATDFGQYFTYFSFFLVVSALLLASLFFKLGIEQRVREVGLLRAVGFDAGRVRRLFVGEGLVLAVAGSALGVPGALAYAWLIMAALRTWWFDAVGTTALVVHASAASLAGGAVGGVLAAVVCVWWTLRGLRHISERSLLAGQLSIDAPGGARSRAPFVAAAVLAVVGLTLMAATALGTVAAAGAFFGAGASLLAAAMCVFSAVLRTPPRRLVSGHGWKPLWRLGLRGAAHRPGRSVLSATVIASATFMLISVDAFRRDTVLATENQKSGVGGFQILVETEIPLVYEIDSPAGRRAVGLAALGDPVKFESFRLRPGDDASCLNLYAPTNPRILAPRDEFLRGGRFQFQSSLATTDAERANPWLLLKRAEADGAVPVIADANSMQYVLHRALGEDIVITVADKPVKLRLVAALRDSIFQSELLMARASFLRLFPERPGYQVFLVDTPPPRASAVAAAIEDALADYGADATLTADRLASFHRVENTYLTTFQTLGGLGLLLGTVGLATVLLRNALERRKELALLGAVGYRASHFGLMAIAENTMLMGVGLAAGAVASSLAIAPALVERGGRLPLTASGMLLVAGVFTTGLLSSAFATRAVARAPLLASLRSE